MMKKLLCAIIVLGVGLNVIYAQTNQHVTIDTDGQIQLSEELKAKLQLANMTEEDYIKKLDKSKIEISPDLISDEVKTQKENSLSSCNPEMNSHFKQNILPNTSSDVSAEIISFDEQILSMTVTELAKAKSDIQSKLSTVSEGSEDAIKYLELIQLIESQQ